MSDQKENGSQQKQADMKPTTIRWDASTIKNAYANVCNVSSTQEEVVLNLG
jgi:hypothetical protein